MPHSPARVHRMFDLVEPIATITYSEVPFEAFLALGMRNYLDGYFAGASGASASVLGMRPMADSRCEPWNCRSPSAVRMVSRRRPPLAGSTRTGVEEVRTVIPSS